MTETNTYLYRIENPNVAAKPDGVVSHEAVIGQWFSPNPDAVVQYLKKSQKEPGSRLVIATVPDSNLRSYHVSEHPVASQMDVENDNYLLPRDGTIPMTTIPLDEVTGDLNPNNLRQRIEATERIRSTLGELSLLN